MQNLFMLIFYVFSFYAFLPGLISRTFGFRAFKRGRVEREIALTFDDGPDPRYTPLLLDLLKRYGAKATFFVVGAHAERHPELLKRMVDEGHVIGIHNYEHKTNWLMRPKTVKRHIHKTEEVIKKATGSRAIFYRPPWGIVNMFDYSLGNLHIILWSSLFGDWRYKLGAKRLEQRLMKKLKAGEVILLHDCGMTPGADERAPENMIKALEAYVAEGTRRGFRFVAIDEMIALTEKSKSLVPSRMKRLMIRLWLGWETLFHAAFRTIPVGLPAPTFHYRMAKYHGGELHIGEGQEPLRNGDPIVELHFDNKLLMKIAHKSTSPIASAIRLVRAVEKELPHFASVLAKDPVAKAAKAVYGVTMITRGADRLGFHIHDLPKGLFVRMSKIYLRFLMRVLTPSHKSNKSKKSDKLTSEIIPRAITFSIPDLLKLAHPANAVTIHDNESKQAARKRDVARSLQNAEQMDLELEGAVMDRPGG
ncbi:polysaccharide deacetylase family protein [Paenibacillus sp. MMS18-CY102]|uniref:polysaccharide deacetylase family protein n=1 Tax=Paenibacillus sp. MMS18-CY102 TaxID=2682849 RepID=UPI0013659574|nr:polysaccharide deacetylase family protein [Paenibacillus sp. MMS18-CY102]MWC30476.1 polysaccharide deacetylase family protein [Paenibacillus sp. MMS18-CY102]